MILTPFMEALRADLVAKKEIAESTALTYIRALYALNGSAGFKSLAFLKKTDGVDKVLRAYAPSTQRAMLAAVSSVLHMFKDAPKFKRVYQHYYGLMMNEAKQAAAAPRNLKTPKQEQSWKSWDEVLKRRDELEAAAKSGAMDWLPCLVLSLYTMIPPRRNADYMRMRVVRKWSESMPSDVNYLDKQGKRFIYNQYKTAKTYGSQIIAIPADLMAIINNYLRATADSAKTDMTPFLQYPNGQALTAQNAITRVLNGIFGGRHIGSSMLRHIYLTDKYGKELQEMKADASAMGHSIQQQRDYVKGNGLELMDVDEEDC